MYNHEHVTLRAAAALLAVLTIACRPAATPRAVGDATGAAGDLQRHRDGAVDDEEDAGVSSQEDAAVSDEEPVAQEEGEAGREKRREDQRHPLPTSQVVSPAGSGAVRVVHKGCRNAAKPSQCVECYGQFSDGAIQFDTDPLSTCL